MLSWTSSTNDYIIGGKTTWQKNLEKTTMEILPAPPRPIRHLFVVPFTGPSCARIRNVPAMTIVCATTGKTIAPSEQHTKTRGQTVHAFFVFFLF